MTDDKNIQRQIILTSFTKKTKAMMYSGCVQFKLSPSWEHININLANATSALFGTKYVETVRIKVSAKFSGENRALIHVHTNSRYFGLFLQIHANCRIRSVYFADRLYTYEELPNDYKVVEKITSLVINPVLPVSAEQHRPKKQKQPGFQSLLNSVEKNPLKLWRKVVSIYKIIHCLEPACLFVRCFQLLSSLLSVVL